MTVMVFLFTFRCLLYDDMICRHRWLFVRPILSLLEHRLEQNQRTYTHPVRCKGVNHSALSTFLLLCVGLGGPQWTNFRARFSDYMAFAYSVYKSMLNEDYTHRVTCDLNDSFSSRRVTSGPCIEPVNYSAQHSYYCCFGWSTHTRSKLKQEWGQILLAFFARRSQQFCLSLLNSYII